MLEALLGGIGMGLVLSTFIGPVFFMMLDLGINGTLKSIFFLAFGTFVSDLFSVIALNFFATKYISTLENIDFLYIIGGGLLVYLGIRDIVKSQKNKEKIRVKQSNNMVIFMKGFLVNILNPNVFFFWFGAVMLAINTYNQNTELVYIHFLCGLLVVFISDFLKGFGAYQLKQHITPKLMNLINKISGVVILGFGIKLIFFH